MKTARELWAIAIAARQERELQKIAYTQETIEKELIPALENYAKEGESSMIYFFSQRYDFELARTILTSLGFKVTPKRNPLALDISWSQD